jgi:glycine/D-amino acid oxidase-like deaminating enzyme
MSTPETVDAVVIGANMRGLVTAHLLDALGYRAVLIERGPKLGGADGTFVTPGGARFEYGLHVLDEDRSEIATRLFRRAVDDRVHRVRLERGIVLRGQAMPYAPRPSQMPDELRRMLPGEELVDALGDDPPTRANLARHYGRAFTDLVFDEVLPSYPSENRHRRFGVDESRLLANIYPWFFPRAQRRSKSGDESRAFHDRLRNGLPQWILYPREGGFSGFAEGLLRKLDRARIEVLMGADDLRLELAPGSHTVAAVHAKGRVLRARHVFWAGPWEPLCRILGLPCQSVATDRVMLGSFVFDRPATSAFNELLVGDPSFSLARVYFPGRWRESDDPLMQVEFAVPKAEDWPADPEHWRAKWLDDARRLGLIGAQHRLVEFDFKAITMHFNGFGMEGEPLRDADPSAIQAGSNLHPVVPSMANLNLNRYVPRAIAEVGAVLARD